jgi:hypothetical protein
LKTCVPSHLSSKICKSNACKKKKAFARKAGKAGKAGKVGKAGKAGKAQKAGKSYVHKELGRIAFEKEER